MSQPTLWRGREKATRMGQRCVLHWRKMRGVATNVYSRKTSEKPKKEKVEGLRILKMRVRESFTHGESISTPRAYHKGRQPLIECANHDFNIIYFPFLSLFSLFMFLLFWSRQGCFPCSYVSSGVMRKSGLRSSLRTKGLFVTLILSFLKDWF